MLVVVILCSGPRTCACAETATKPAAAMTRAPRLYETEAEPNGLRIESSRVLSKLAYTYSTARQATSRPKGEQIPPVMRDRTVAETVRKSRRSIRKQRHR